MPDKTPEEKDDLSELLKKIGAPFAGFLGAVTLVYNFYKMWLGDQKTVTYITAGVGLFVLIIALLWVALSKRKVDLAGTRSRKTAKPHSRFKSRYRKAAWTGLGVITLLVILGIVFLIQHRQSQEKILAEQQQKLIVVIAAFEGPEAVYGLRNEIIESLNTDFSNDENIEIIPIDEIITLSQGSNYARKLGESLLADVVIWGWYRPTQNPNITIHIENLSPDQLLPMDTSETLQPAITLSELKSFSFQQQAGKETSVLISFLAGFIDYKNGDYEFAQERFNHAISKFSNEPQLIQIHADIYFYRGNSSSFLKEYDLAIHDYEQAIKIEPQSAIVYNNRGSAYGEAGDYERAIQDYTQAIQLDPQYAMAYYGRGVSYTYLGDYDSAIQEYDQAINIDPQLITVYYNRGTTYTYLNEFPHAIEDFNQVIRLDPQYVKAYVNRGNSYAAIGEYQLAIQDFNQAIQLDPQNAIVYSNRGGTYVKLGDSWRAIQDFNQAIQIDPQLASAYYNRGFAYQSTGQASKAVADFAKYKELTGEDAP